MKKKTILAIDVGTGMVKVFAGRKQADGSVMIFGSGTAPTAGYERGVITDSSALAHSIRQAVDCVMMTADSQTIGCAYLGISGSSLMMQNSSGSIAPTTPGEITPQDIERACKAAVFAVADNAFQNLHVFSVKETVAKPGAALEVEAHIVAAPKEILQGITQKLAQTGLELSGIVAGGVVAAEMIKEELPGKPDNFIFMDIGAGTADLVMYAGGKLCYSASLPLGGDYITNDLMQGLSVNRVHAEEIKRYYSRLSPDLHNQAVVLDCNDYGTTDKHIPFDFLYDIIESRVDEIGGLLHAFLKPHIATYLAGQEQSPECIYVTGGTGAMPSMVACIARIFQVHTEAIKPMQAADEYAQPMNTVCYGIMRYGATALASESTAGEANSWNVFIDKAKKLLRF